MSERNIEWVTRAQLHQITGVDPKTINIRLRDVHFETRGRSQVYDKLLAITAITSTKQVITGEDQAKKRKLDAEADKVEIIVAKMRGELVPVAEMKAAAAELIRTLYQRIVRVEPGIIAPKLIGLTDHIKIESVIREALSTAFDELKTMPDHFLSIDPEITDDEPASDEVYIPHQDTAVPAEVYTPTKKLSMSID